MKFINVRKENLRVTCDLTGVTLLFKPGQERDIHSAHEDICLRSGLVPMDAVNKLKAFEEETHTDGAIAAALALDADAEYKEKRAKILDEQRINAEVEARVASKKRSDAAKKAAETRRQAAKAAKQAELKAELRAN